MMPDNSQTLPWFDENWSRGLLLGLTPDPNSGYRATVWFEYTRALFNKIREGSLIAVRNFSDRPRSHDGSPEGNRQVSYEEYSILQIDQVHPWHYAIQGTGDQGFPGFTTAAAESARRDWTEMDEVNRDDVSRIRCMAIPLRLAFNRNAQNGELPECFPDRSMPMPGYEAQLLTPEMTESIVNRGLDTAACVELGRHVVQQDVSVRIHVPGLLRLHFGVFGFTGAGKSNLISTLARKTLSGPPNREGKTVHKIVVFDLMDEYTGLLIDQLVRHQYSRLIVGGRKTLPECVLKACQAVARQDENAERKALEAARDWADSLILPRELSLRRADFAQPLKELIVKKKVLFYETQQEQGRRFHIPLGKLLDEIGPGAYGKGSDFQQETNVLRASLEPLISEAEKADPQKRDPILDKIIAQAEQEKSRVTTKTARSALDSFIQAVREQKGARGALAGVGTSPRTIAGLLNYQPSQSGQTFQPSLVVVIGENGGRIADFGKLLIENTFEERRSRSLLDPTVAFVFDEADVFVAYQDRRASSEAEARMVDEATLLARRGRKFGLGLGIATQRIRYLDTSIMAQPHTYFISRLPRKSDRDAIAEAFAISDETLEQTFAFTKGQWLVASHDATGLKGTPFPVQVENANDKVREWLKSFNSHSSKTDYPKANG